MKRLLIILLFILLSVFPISAQFAGGSGTSGDPYQIATALQLDSVRHHLSSHYILTANIDLSGYSDWKPIGYTYGASNPFNGTLDGNGKTISNMRITSMLYDSTLHNVEIGLFTWYNGDINRLTLYHCSIIISDTGTGVMKYNHISAGLLAPISSSGGMQDFHIRDCNIDITLVDGHYYGVNASGITSFNNSFTVEYKKCSVVGLNISVHRTYVGGSDAINICGLFSTAGRPGVSECFVDSTILYCSPGVTNSYIQGIGSAQEIKNSYTKVKINGGNPIVSCGFSTTVTADSNCYSVPTMLSTPVDGFANYYPNASTSCYFDSTVAGSSQDGEQGGHTPRAYPKSTTQMKTQATFSGWDFVNIWAIKSYVNDGYPYLINNPPNIPALVSKRLRIRK